MEYKNKATFSPKRYLNGEINCKCCNHELLSTSAFDDGTYGANYDCLICGEHICLPMGHFYADDEAFINQNVGCLSMYDDNLLISTLQFICKRYINEDAIDIVDIFKQIKPGLDEISMVINRPTEKEQEEIKRRYDTISSIADEETVTLPKKKSDQKVKVHLKRRVTKKDE